MTLLDMVDVERGVSFSNLADSDLHAGIRKPELQLGDKFGSTSRSFNLSNFVLGSAVLGA